MGGKRWAWPCANCEEGSWDHPHIPGTNDFKCPFASTVYRGMSADEYLARTQYLDPACPDNTTIDWNFLHRYGDRRMQANREVTRLEQGLRPNSTVFHSEETIGERYLRYLRERQRDHGSNPKGKVGR